MAARHRFQAAVVNLEPVDVEEDAHKAQVRIVIGVFVAVPMRTPVAARAVERDTVVKSNLLTKDSPRQVEHMWMGNEALQIGVILRRKSVGLVAFDSGRYQVLNVRQRRRQSFAGLRRQDAGQEKVPVFVQVGFLLLAKVVRLKYGGIFHGNPLKNSDQGISIAIASQSIGRSHSCL